MSAPSKPAALWPEGLSPDRWLEWFTDLDAPARYDVASAVLETWDKAYAVGWSDGLAELRARLEQEWATEGGD